MEERLETTTREDSSDEATPVTRIPLMKRIVESAVLDEKRQNFIQEFLKRKDEMPKLVTDTYDDDKIGIEKQLDESDKILSELLQNGNDAISNIRLANDRREVQRRMKEAELRDILLNDLQHEAHLSTAKFDEISNKWPYVDENVDPMTINDGLDQQKARISELMNQKMSIVNECREELKAADVRYIQDLDKHNSDVNCLVERIDKQMEVKIIIIKN